LMRWICHVGNMAATDAPRRKLVRPLGSCVRFVTICRNLSRFTRPGGGHELFEVTKFDRECRFV
jgi:hypothetical protein